ncbi:hypothetical protein [Clostridium cuniculi]|uniref:hypothetical protein n=1 Tax=Clostridium cuniculi TaxID=2548455 RepID=UPI001056AE16|nr:hypothetical protein [Clostridium cuniculi]
MGLLIEKFLFNVKFNWVFGAGIGGIFQIIAYTLVKIPLFGVTCAIAGIYGLTIQTISGVIISILVISIILTYKRVSIKLTLLSILGYLDKFYLFLLFKYGNIN